MASAITSNKGHTFTLKMAQRHIEMARACERLADQARKASDGARAAKFESYTAAHLRIAVIIREMVDGKAWQT